MDDSGASQIAFTIMLCQNMKPPSFHTETDTAIYFLIFKKFYYFSWFHWMGSIEFMLIKMKTKK